MGPFGVGEDFFGDQLRDDVVVVDFHAVAAFALRHGGELGAVGEHLGHGNLGVDDRGAALGLHSAARGRGGR
jgi:hypothetical protein